MARKPKLLQWVKDDTAPTLTTVTFVSDNSTTTLAKVGDVVTLAFVPSEAIVVKAVTIAGKNVLPTETNPLSYTVDYTMASGDAEGSVPISIKFEDLYGNAGTEVTATTGAEIVTFDETAPTLDSAVRDSDTAITVTLSELAAASTLEHADDAGFVVFQTGTPGTAYVVSGTTAGGTDDDVVLTVADISASIAEGVTVTYATGGNGDIADPTGNAMVTDATGVVIATWA